MTKKLSIAGLVLAAAATSAFAFSAPPAKAACTGSSTASTTCDQFDPSSSTTIEFLGYGDAGFANSTGVASIEFKANQLGGWAFTPTPISISNIEYSFNNGGSWSSIDIATPINLASGGTTGNIVTAQLPGTTSGTVGTNQFRLRFTVPSVLSGTAGVFNAEVAAYGNGIQVQNRFISVDAFGGGGGAGVPGPLPLFGAGAAFAFSRSMRRRIAQSV